MVGIIQSRALLGYGGRPECEPIIYSVGSKPARIDQSDRKTGIWHGAGGSIPQAWPGSSSWSRPVGTAKNGRSVSAS